MHVLSSLQAFIHAPRACARVKRILISAQVDHSLSKCLLENVKHAPCDWQPPGRETPGGSLLYAQHDVNLRERAALIEHPGVRKFGLAATTDGATIEKHLLLNFILLRAIWTQMVFIKCNDCTQHLAENGPKYAEYTTTLMIALIRALPHPGYLDQIVTDGAGDMGKFKRLVVGLFFWIYCVWHLRLAPAQLRLPSRGERREDQDARREGEDDRRPVWRLKTLRAQNTRFGLYFTVLHRLLVLRKVVVTCGTCDEYTRMNYTDDEEYDIIVDSNFWECAELVRKPLVGPVAVGCQGLQSSVCSVGWRP